MQRISKVLKMRSDLSKEGLPELGAVLGRGSFGKVYKGGYHTLILTAALQRYRWDHDCCVHHFKTSHIHVLCITPTQCVRMTAQQGSNLMYFLARVILKRVQGRSPSWTVGTCRALEGCKGGC